MTIFFSGNTFFDNLKAIEKFSRPFTTVEEMNSSLIFRWNACVKPNDIVFHLGNFATCSLDRCIEIAQQLNGNKIIIQGPHDRMLKQLRHIGFSLACRKLIYPILFNGKMKNLFLTHHMEIKDIYDLGIHAELQDGKRVLGTHVSVSTDLWDYEPVALEVLETIFKDKE